MDQGLVAALREMADQQRQMADSLLRFASLIKEAKEENEAVKSPLTEQAQAQIKEDTARFEAPVTRDEYNALASEAISKVFESAGGNVDAVAAFCTDFLKPWGVKRFKEIKEENVQEVANKLKEFVCKP